MFTAKPTIMGYFDSNNELLWGLVAHDFGLLGLPGRSELTGPSRRSAEAIQ